MNKTPDSWDDEWSTAADDPAPTHEEPESKKLTTKQTKAQKRAAQAEFNRQIWAEAEGPRETNYFLESRNVVPLRQQFRAPTVLLSRKGPPIVQKTDDRPVGVQHALEKLTINARNGDNDDSEDEEDKLARAEAERNAKLQADRQREEKRKLYEQRRAELLGPSNPPGGSNQRPTSRSGQSSPGSLTPPGSRSSTPHTRGNRRGGGRGGRGNFNAQQTGPQKSTSSQLNPQSQAFDPLYMAKPGSTFLMRRDQSPSTAENGFTKPIRAPRNPDNTAGFAQRRLVIPSNEGTSQNSQTGQAAQTVEAFVSNRFQ